MRDKGIRKAVMEKEERKAECGEINHKHNRNFSSNREYCKKKKSSQRWLSNQEKK